jgi:NitT/TauT family transport system permease protein
MRENPYLSAVSQLRTLVPNRWDIVAIPLIFGVVFALVIGVRQMAAPVEVLQTTAITLDPSNLPEYALRTVLRMLAALVASLVFTLVYGALAAKSRRLAVVLIPLLDVLQSVPVLGYLSFTVTFFLGLFPFSVAGAELAAIFAIFTSQAWNMTFSFYQSLITVPHDLDEAARAFRFSRWQRFWRLDLPFAMPGLVWNMMMSMSGGWFFVVASEAITVGDNHITLPGIGAYVAIAIEHKDLAAVGWAILAMTVVILLYDQLMFRPLVAWADKFRFENVGSQLAPESWLLTLLQRARFVQRAAAPVGRVMGVLLRLPNAQFRLPMGVLGRLAPPARLVDIAWYALLALGALWTVHSVFDYLSASLGWSDLFTTLKLGTYTMIRVIVLIAVATVIWVPIGVAIGLRPKLAEKVQPLAQFLSSRSRSSCWCIMRSIPISGSPR